MNDRNAEFSKIMEARTMDFAAKAYRLIGSYPRNDSARDIKRQLFRSASSVGANYREANRSRSSADFKSRIKICESEASETVYWLELSRNLELEESKKIDVVLSEARELLAIFSTVSKKLHQKK